MTDEERKHVIAVLRDNVRRAEDITDDCSWLDNPKGPRELGIRAIANDIANSLEYLADVLDAGRAALKDGTK